MALLRPLFATKHGQISVDSDVARGPVPQISAAPLGIDRLPGTLQLLDPLIILRIVCVLIYDEALTAKVARPVTLVGAQFFLSNEVRDFLALDLVVILNRVAQLLHGEVAETKLHQSLTVVHYLSAKLLKLYGRQLVFSDGIFCPQESTLVFHFLLQAKFNACLNHANLNVSGRFLFSLFLIFFSLFLQFVIMLLLGAFLLRSPDSHPAEICKLKVSRAFAFQFLSERWQRQDLRHL